MKKLFFTGLITLGMFSFTSKEERVKESTSYEFERVCVLWEITTTHRNDGSTTSSSKCRKFRDDNVQ